MRAGKLKFWGCLEYIASKRWKIFQGSFLFYACHSALQILKVEIRLPISAYKETLFSFI